MKAEDLCLPDPTEIPAENIAPIITRLLIWQSALAARLSGSPVKASPHDSKHEGEDELLNAVDAARLLNVSEDWIYRRANRLPFTRRLSRKALRFSKAGLLKWTADRIR